MNQKPGMTSTLASLTLVIVLGLALWAIMVGVAVHALRAMEVGI